MGFCLDTAKHGPICIGDAFAQLNDGGIGLTQSGLGLMAVIAITVFAFILRSPSKR